MMIRFALCISFLVAAFFTNAQQIEWYLPDSLQYADKVPKPSEIIHHEVGEWHVTHDRLVNYMHALAAAAPDRVKLETMGFTYERRPQVLLVITSPANHRRLEEIRLEHLRLSDPSSSASLDIDKMPVVVWIGHSIHGNEQSGTNAALLTAYYLAAAQGRKVDELLENTVILLDPSFNPDGMQRFSTWVNQHKSATGVTDPASREFNEVWPGGRFNHYWFDLNRDWLPAVHPESRNRLAWFQKWKPNILTDHHEQGKNATFFFQPGVPSRVNPLTPDRNKELTAALGKFHAAFLDRIGSLYFTKENYDDFYYGKGSTYPDINGAVGILFEQASSRGHLQETDNGLLSFPFTIRNQFVTALSTLEGAVTLRKEFLSFQREFYQSSIREVKGVQGYVYGDDGDPARQAIFTEMLLRHNIEVHSLKADYRDGATLFPAGTSMLVPLRQPQGVLVRAIFEKTLQYQDSLFYDITSWTMPLAYGLPYGSVQQVSGLQGKRIDSLPPGKGQIIGVGANAYAYLIDWKHFYAPRMLYALQRKKVKVKVSMRPFSVAIDGRSRAFAGGTLLVPVSGQEMSKEALRGLLTELAAANGVEVTGVAGGSSESGSDLGSSRFSVTRTPSIALLTGQGVTALDAGEAWHLLDQRMQIPVTQLEPSMFNRADLRRYTTIVLVGGTYGELQAERLKTWVQQGGTLIVMEQAINWAINNGISAAKLRKPLYASDSLSQPLYSDREQVDGSRRVSGIILSAMADTTHPLAFGYAGGRMNVFKANTVILEKGKDPYAIPFWHGTRPLLSGWASRDNLKAMDNSAAVLVTSLGSGKVIHMADNPNFRGFWLGGTKLFMNALFFGHLIQGGSSLSSDD